ncbi:site-specific integrase [Roseivirga spongicola]|uniref:site-specific integrase n=1 Tax=Roseivirga spongicola TaxID=333140 RepID=UPI002AC94813|nr:tyrosine-type recombinase/integrase [Roseivirga spongicola]WPZ08708.1 phage integrase SAM-like domain-containing protein [Roseivirga spongicola]
MKNVKRVILSNQANKEGYCTIYFEVSDSSKPNRSRKRISSDIKVKPKSWSKKKSLVLKSDPDFLIKNERLDEKLNEIVGVKPEVEKNNQSELINYLEQFIELRIALGRKRTSYKEFITIKNRMIQFEEFRLSQGLNRIRFQDLTLRFSDDLKMWMSSRKYDPNTIKKHFLTLKTFVNHYFNRRTEYPEIQFTDDYLKSEFGKVNTHSSPPLPLNDTEFSVLQDCDHLLVNKPSLMKVKDAFLFGCVTGLRYSDLFTISRANIREGLIIVSPSKTENTKSDNHCRIPLNLISQSILEKYNWNTRALKLSNQVYNRRLKELFQLLGFDDLIETKIYSGLGSPSVKVIPKYKLISSHNARDTFITMCIKKGIGIPLIMEMTGHTKYETMKKYVKLDDTDLLKLMGSFLNG